MRYSLPFFFIVIFVCSFNQKVIAKASVFEYKNYTPKENSLVRVAIVDLSKAKLVIGRAQDLGRGLDTVENIAKHYDAVVAVNGGFFRFNSTEFNNAVPAGILKINNDWHGIAYKARGAVGWDSQTAEMLFDILQTDSRMLIKNKRFPINAMNKVSSGNKATLLSDSYYDTINVSSSLALLILNQRINTIYNNGIVSVPKHGYIYDVSGGMRQNMSDIKPGDSAVVDIKLKPHFAKDKTKLWNKLPNVLGGGPLLINNSKKITDFSMERMNSDFIYSNYARTAIGVLPDKRVVLVVAEQPSLHTIVGLSIPELRDFMYSLGCIFALNLDGGRSSNMYTTGYCCPAEITDITQHQVADALLVIPN